MKHDSSSDPSPDMALEIAASKFAALGSEQRLNVLKTLVRSGPEGLSIGELGKRTGVTGSTLTHHLRILTQADLVRQSRAGRSIICAAAAYEEVRALSAFLLTNCCADCAAAEHDHG
ncbi:metalloregulator ArsR/SmtB family transcription factor [Salipiger sp. P9]|uniref:ArsR/SmtB family transcription factor n=1 Tax=Salipiger pentaromativorans TaxID=2943193 RepID=UPI002157670C|nr:metalloregulator ArsR/SmtB family transcription factor [Salipiger pentaromativorans]MCR8549359.1 metalloregulator ArsR/SmtB family transcription factor [Salipiger pentaromativorans]